MRLLFFLPLLIFSQLLFAHQTDQPNQRVADEYKIFTQAEKLYKNGHQEQALLLYEERAKMGGAEEETFWSLFQIAQIKNALDYPIDEVIGGYMKAHRFRPHRPEPVYYLAVLYNRQREFSLAYECLKGWEALPKPKKKDLLCTLDWIEEYGLLFERSICTYYLGYHRQCVEDCNTLLALTTLPTNYRERTQANRKFVSFQEGKTVLISIIAQNKAHLLPTFLKCIDNLDYDKDLITIYITTDNNADMTQEILEQWVKDHGKEFRSVFFETGQVWNTGLIRNKSLQKALNLDCDYYFAIECDNFIAPYTLKDLVFKDKPIIAPLLRPIPHYDTAYSNFFIDVDKKGYYKHHPDYFKIFNSEERGTFKVPLVHQTYLVNRSVIPQLTYIDRTTDWEYIIFGRSARNHQIKQYICNEKDYGTFFHAPYATSLKANQMVWDEVCKGRERFDYFDPPLEMILEKDQKTLPDSVLYQRGQNNVQKKKHTSTLEVLCQCEQEKLDENEQFGLLKEIAHLSEILDFPEEITVKRYLDLHHAFPDRIEPLLSLCKYYYKREKFHEAYVIAEMGYNLSCSLLRSGKTGWLIECGMPWEFAHAAHGIGNFEQAIALVEGILEHPTLHEWQRKTLKRNLFYYKAGVQITHFAKEKWGVPHWEVPEMAVRKLPPYMKTNHTPRLHICTYASDWRPQLSQLKESCTYFGHDLLVLGLDKPFSFGQVMRDFREYLETIHPDDVVLFIDAYDILILADEKKILKSFAKFDAPCVASTEMNCHPLPHFSYFYREEAPTNFKYLNSGAYMGYASYMKDVFDAVSPIPDETDDQGLLSAFYLYHPTSLKLDYFGDLFLSLYLVEQDEMELDYEKRQAKCLITDRIPCLIHGNGPGKRLYQHIYNELFKKN